MKEHTVLVTGASAGIGRATAEKFYQAGARVILLARRFERLQEIVKAMDPERAMMLPVDLLDTEAARAALESLSGEWAEISILVNNAGCAVGMDSVWDAELSDWDTMVDLNIRSLLQVTRWILPGMVERDRGHVINVGSVAGTYPYKGGNIYGATKAFVEQFSHNLRCDLLGKKVRVTNIEPGLVETEFSLVRFRGDAEKAKAVYADVEAMTGEDIAEAIVWSASVPERMNINRIEMMSTMQTAGGFRFHRTPSPA